MRCQVNQKCGKPWTSTTVPVGRDPAAELGSATT